MKQKRIQPHGKKVAQPNSPNHDDMMYTTTTSIATTTERRRARFFCIFAFACLFSSHVVFRARRSLLVFLSDDPKVLVSEEDKHGRQECAASTTTTTPPRILNKKPFNVRKHLKLKVFPSSNDKNDNNNGHNRTSSSRGARQERQKQQQRQLPYSSHHCVDHPEFGISHERWYTRTCMFYNMYFEPSTETFHYYPPPSLIDASALGGGNVWRYELPDMRTSAGYMTKRIAYRKKAFHYFDILVHTEPTTAAATATATSDNSEQQAEQQQSPIIVLPDPSTVAVVADDSPSFRPVFVLYKPSYEFNFGHFVFDSVLSIFTMLDFFGYNSNGSSKEKNTKQSSNSCRPPHSYQPIPVHLEQHHGPHDDPFFRCRREEPAGRWSLCSKILKRVMASWTGIQPDVTIRNATFVDVDIPRTGNLFGPPAAAGTHPADAADDDAVDGKRNATSGSGSGSGSTAATPASPSSYLVPMPAGTEMVLLDRVISGPGRLPAISCEKECTVHRATQMQRFRKFLLRNIYTAADESGGGKSIQQQQQQQQKEKEEEDGDNDGATRTITQEQQQQQKQEQNVILVSVPVNNTHGPDAICEFQKTNLVPALRQHFEDRGNANDDNDSRCCRVVVTDLATLTLREQAKLISKTAVYITNQGGGGVTSLLLPPGSTSIFFYPGERTNIFPLEQDVYGTAGGYMNVEWVSKDDYCTNNNNDTNDNDKNATEQQEQERADNFVTLIQDLLDSNAIQQRQQQQQWQ